MPAGPSPVIGPQHGYYGRCVSGAASRPSYRKGKCYRPSGVGLNVSTSTRIVHFPKVMLVGLAELGGGRFGRDR